jgi:hypothetical protein
MVLPPSSPSNRRKDSHAVNLMPKTHEQVMLHISDKINDALAGENMVDCYSICLVALSFFAKDLGITINSVAHDLRHLGVLEDLKEKIR